MSMGVIVRTALLALTPLALACGGSKSTGPNGNGDYFTASIDGATFTADVLLSARLTFGSLDIQGSRGPLGQVEAMTLSLTSVTGPGTFVIGSGGGGNAASIAATTPSGGVNNFGTVYGGTGSVIITELSGTRVSGTFTFTAPPSPANASQAAKNVSNGRFSMALQTS